MKKLLLLALLLTSSFSYADLLSPKGIVVVVVNSAKEGEVIGLNPEALANSKPSLNKESFLKLFKEIDTEKLIFKPKDKERNLYGFRDESDETKFRVYLVQPISLIFEVRYVDDDSIGCGGYMEVIAINQPTEQDASPNR